MYHVSNHSYIDDTGSGNLKVRSNNLRVSNGDESKVYATFKPSEVDLYANNSIRLTTSGSGVEVTGIITATTGHFDSVTGPSSITIDPATIGDNTGLVVIKGNLQVDGTTTTVNSTTLTVTDKNIEIAKGAANDAAVDGAGITVDSTQGNKTWNWVDATDSWTSSEHIRVAADRVFGFANDPNTFIDRPRADTIAFTNNNSETVRIRSDGKVSIGKTTGDGLINTLNTGVNQQILQFHVNLPSFSNRTLNLFGPETDTTSGFFTFQTGDAIRFQIESIDALTVASDGQIGIGTTNPDELLHLKSTASTVKAKIESTATNSYPTLRLKNDAREYDLQLNGATDAFRVYDVTATEERLTITSSGDVGIGIANPQGRLHISSGTSGDCQLIIESDTDNNNETDNPRILFRQDGGQDLNSIGLNFSSNVGNDNNSLYLASSGSQSGIIFLTGTSDGYTNATEAVRITGIGSVGIGTTSPDAKLSVVGIGSFKEDVYIDKKLYVSGIEIGGPGGPGIGTDITTRHLRVTGITTFVSGNVDVNSDVDINRSLSVTGGVSVTGISSFVSFLDVNDTTQSSDKDTGSIITEGGVGIEKNLNVGGVINSSTDVRINGTSVVDSALNDAVAMAIALG